MLELTEFFVLPGTQSAGVGGELLTAVFEARCEYAELLLRGDEHEEALAAARAAVAAEPLREDGWRVLMRAAAATAGGAAAVPVYLECVRSLRTIGLGPSGDTTALLERLRDPVPAAAGGVIPA
jgi:DNA-binding SARP family transcriptional activator